ncbi:aromatic ring-hydroxylating dioxygenase subunit alpha [Iodidimonas sp. SYSU 1G8]|uniref:aromatic ring-hydroxylating oxygenase subunit alpha n=1 Tax=Iodidimonas sp. SYSU 1G8 TaxID=3133967 RepID=UPI0031FF2B8C
MNVQAHETLEPGEARCPGPSTRDLILRDGWNVPPELVTESYEFLGDEDIPYERYTSRALFAREMEKLWPKVWQWACREEHVPEVGDYHVYDVGNHSILVIRVAEDEIKAYYNSCLHRGTQLRPSDSTGSVTQLRCPFHGWTWNLDGSLREIPCRWDFPKVTDEAFSLPEVKVARWGGFVFINMDPDAMPLEEYLEVLPAHFANWPLDRRYTAVHVQKILPANWKAAQEAFAEAYHVLETHSQALYTASDANAQYDVFGERTSRFIHTVGIPSPHLTEPVSQEEILKRMRGGQGDMDIPLGGTARAVVADHLRQALGEAYKIDLSAWSPSELMDSIQYHLFPNTYMHSGITLPLIYRFRPNGMDTESAIFDILVLRPIPEGEAAPEPPEPVKLGVDDSYLTVRGLDPGLAQVYDQDTKNLGMQQRAFHNRGKRGETLGNYQEIRIRRMHKTLDTYLRA